MNKGFVHLAAVQSNVKKQIMFIYKYLNQKV